MVMRKFDDRYSAERNVHEALATFEDRLPSGMWRAIRDALVAYKEFSAAKARAFEVISG
jgi:predicted component of type VI protein secretion system